MAPYMTPWSVIPSAGISSSAARATKAGMRLAPSSSEYSVWLWRWTKVLGACGIVWWWVWRTPGIVYLGPGNQPRPAGVMAYVLLRVLLGMVIWSLGPGHLRLAMVKLH